MDTRELLRQASELTKQYSNMAADYAMRDSTIDAGEWYSIAHAQAELIAAFKVCESARFASAKIVKFGTITENAKGGLTIEDFWTEGEPDNVKLIDLIIERLKQVRDSFVTQARPM